MLNGGAIVQAHRHLNWLERWHGVRASLVVVMIFACIASWGAAGNRAEAASDVGNVELYTGPLAFCDFTIGDGDIYGEELNILYTTPKVFASPAWNAANPGKKQIIRLSRFVSLVSYPAAATPALDDPSPLEATAGFGSAPAIFSIAPLSFADLPIHGVIQLSYRIEWRNADNTATLGSTQVTQPLFRSVNGGPLSASATESCAPPPVAFGFGGVNPLEPTVNQSMSVIIRYGKLTESSQTNFGTRLFWDDKEIILLDSGDYGDSYYQGLFKVPASPKGPHTVKIQRVDGTSATKIVTVKPRIKLIPGTAARGSTVNVSLRGFTANESIKIRWQKPSGSWVQVATVTTSKTGSANVNVVVPNWAPDGAAKVRGDGATSAAQTSAFMVSGGAFVPAAKKPAKPAKTPTPTPTPSPTIMPDASPTATSTPEASPEPVVTEEATAEPIVTETPTEEPAVDPTSTPEPTEMPTLEPTTTSESDPTAEPTISDPGAAQPPAEETTPGAGED